MKIKTLSDKRIGAGESFHIKKPRIRDIWHYDEENVKKFIKEIKDCDENEFVERGQFNKTYFRQFINRKAGDILI